MTRGSAVPTRSVNGVGGQWEREFCPFNTYYKTRQDKAHVALLCVVQRGLLLR